MVKQGSKLKWLIRAVATMAAAAALLSGCGGGSDGAQGPAGPAGPAGPVGPVGPAGADKTTGTVDASQLTFTDLKDRALSGKILSVDTSGDKPVVKFQVVMKDTNEGVRGLRTFALHIAQLQPEKDGSASYWLNYLASGLPLSADPTATSAKVNPSADGVSTYNADGTLKAQGYSVVDNGDGTYAVAFGANIKANTKVLYDAKLIHRVVVGVRSVVVPGVVGKTPGAYAGPMNPLTGAAFPQFTNINGVNLVYDFTPSASGAGTMLADSSGKQTFARDNVTVDACNGCHYKIQYGFPRGNNTSGHFGARTDTKTCVICHTPQNTSGEGDFTNFIHKIHMGEELAKVETVVGIAVNEVLYPQDQRSCTTCHAGTVVDSWKKPTLKACGACHNGIDFNTGAGHLGGAKPDDKTCALCHDGASVAVNHVPVAATPNSNVPKVIGYYANPTAMPAGAYKIEYVINGVTVDSARKVSVKFQVKKDGTAVNFGTYNAATNPNIIPNTVGGPSIRIAFNVSQDGITSPADFNASMSSPAIGMAAPTVPTVATPPGIFTPAPTSSNLWVNKTLTVSGITWTLAGPDATNTYTVSSSLPLPISTTMVTALMYGAMTQTNLPAYPFAAASIADFASYVNASKSTAYVLKNSGLILGIDNAKGSVTTGGFTARRTIVDNAKCNACHNQLGVKPTFHGAGRNDGTICNICHTPNSQNSGWSYSFNTFIHGIHGAAKRSVPYTFAADWSSMTYPGLLKNCEQCHVAGSYDFTATANAAAAAGKLLYNTVGAGTTADAGANTAPYIAQTAGTVYGSGFSAATTTGSVVATAAAGTTLVSSPIAAACFSCHDTNEARSHMVLNGGSIYEARSTALAKTETCLVCHGPANNAAFNETVPTIKAVHRWW